MEPNSSDCKIPEFSVSFFQEKKSGKNSSCTFWVDFTKFLTTLAGPIEGPEFQHNKLALLSFMKITKRWLALSIPRLKIKQGVGKYNEVVNFHHWDLCMSTIVNASSDPRAALSQKHKNLLQIRNPLSFGIIWISGQLQMSSALRQQKFISWKNAWTARNSLLSLQKVAATEWWGLRSTWRLEHFLQFLFGLTWPRKIIKLPLCLNKKRSSVREQLNSSSPYFIWFNFAWPKCGLRTRQFFVFLFQIWAWDFRRKIIFMLLRDLCRR